MTNNQITVAVEKLRSKVTPAQLQALRGSMENAEKECMDVIMFMQLKSKGVALALAILLGGFGAGRFYVGDKGLAIARLISSLAAGFLSFVPVLGIILRIGILVWHIIDCVFVYRRASEKNFADLNGYLTAHKKKAGVAK